MVNTHEVDCTPSRGSLHRLVRSFVGFTRPSEGSLLRLVGDRNDENDVRGERLCRLLSVVKYAPQVFAKSVVIAWWSLIRVGILPVPSDFGVRDPDDFVHAKTKRREGS
jgi:hypothetical protein